MNYVECEWSHDIQSLALHDSIYLKEQQQFEDLLHSWRVGLAGLGRCVAGERAGWSAG